MKIERKIYEHLKIAPANVFNILLVFYYTCRDVRYQPRRCRFNKIRDEFRDCLSEIIHFLECYRRLEHTDAFS